MKPNDIIQKKEILQNAKKLGFENIILSSENFIKKGGNLELNRKIVRTAKILLDPVSATEKAFDTAVSQIAKDNDVAIAFSLKSVLDAKGLDKARILRNISFAVEICKKMKNTILIVSNATDEYELRDPVLLEAFGQLIGLSEAQSKWAMREAYEGIKK